jgi:ribosome maturation factor RimP
VVRVTVDAEGGLGVDRIAELARGISRLLDEHDPVAGSYQLEVSSPGLERKLRRPSHYRKAVGREVKVKTVGDVDGHHLHQGVLDEADEAGFVLQLNDGTRRIPYGEVKSATTVYTWERAPKPGSRRR